MIKYLNRAQGLLDVAIMPLVLICARDPNPQKAPPAPAIQLPGPEPGVKPLHAPHPKYPQEARAKHWEGTGLLEVTLRPDGAAAKVTVLQSTGHSILDRDAVAALRQWRFQRARGVDRVRIPLTYSLHCTH